MLSNIVSLHGQSRLCKKQSFVSVSDALIAPRFTRKFQPHEHIFFQGDAPKGIYQVLNGTAILYKVTSDGRRQIQDFASEGDFLGFTFTPEHDLNAEALTETEVQFIPLHAIERALQDDPSFRRDILSLMSSMLMASREQAMLLGRKTAMERTATFLLFLAARFTDEGTQLVSIRMSRCDIADYLGLTLETVSRMMNRLKKDRVIDLPRATTFKVLSLPRLAALAGEALADADPLRVQAH